jgi:hypothetical protein
MAALDAASVTGILRLILRAPSTASVDAEGTITTTFSPPLSAPEQATYDAAVRVLGAPALVPPDTFDGIKPQLVEIRTFRQRSMATWNGLTTQQREADEITYLNDIVDVLRALLR